MALPYISKNKSPVNYLLDANDERNFTQTVHVKRLKPFSAGANKPDLDFLGVPVFVI